MEARAALTRLALTGALLLSLCRDSEAALPRCKSTGWRPFQYGEKYSAYSARAKRRDCRKEWTVLVYMAADNDLTPYAYWDLYEMEAGFRSGKLAAASSTLKSDLVVQLDTAGNRGIRRLHMFQVAKPYDARLDKSHFDSMNEDDIRSPVVERLTEGGTESEAERFERFLEWGLREFPSDHQLVVVWGHGQGWGTSVAGTPFVNRGFGGIAFNQSRGSYLDIPALKDVLTRHPVDVYASDACLMQMLEVANELAGATRFVVGSTQVQNFLGLPYRRLMFELNTGRFAGERAATRSADQAYLLARMMPKVFRASMVPGGLQGRFAPEGIKNVTMSAISSEELRRSLVPALADVSLALNAWLREEPLRAIDLQQALRQSPTVLGGAQELGAFLTLTRLLLRDLAEREGVSSDSATLLDARLSEAKEVLNRTVVAYALGTRYAQAETQLYLLGFKAVSIWLPSSGRDLDNRLADFAASDFYRAVPAWSDWLRLLFGP